MSAIDQVLSIEIVKTEHPRLRAEAISEIAQLRADLQAETQRADVLSSARNVLAAELQAAQRAQERISELYDTAVDVVVEYKQRSAALKYELHNTYNVFTIVLSHIGGSITLTQSEIVLFNQNTLIIRDDKLDGSVVFRLAAHPAPAQPDQVTP